MSNERPGDGSPPPRRIDRHENVPSMNERQTLALLRERGVKPFSLDQWVPGKPVLYVLEEGTRMRIRGDLTQVSPSEVASIARLDNPPSIERLRVVQEVEGLEDTGPIAYRLTNEGGQIDYYAIDPGTKVVKCVGTSYRKGGLSFYLEGANSFFAHDTLFPKSAK